MYSVPVENVWYFTVSSLWLDAQTGTTTSPNACQGHLKGEFEDNTSMEKLAPYVEDRLLDTDINKASNRYSLEVELHTVTKFEDQTGFPMLLSGI